MTPCLLVPPALLPIEIPGCTQKIQCDQIKKSQEEIWFMLRVLNSSNDGAYFWCCTLVVSMLFMYQTKYVMRSSLERIKLKKYMNIFLCSLEYEKPNLKSWISLAKCQKFSVLAWLPKFRFRSTYSIIKDSSADIRFFQNCLI